MSKFGCQCGHVISTVEYPNSIQGWIYGCEVRESFEDEIHTVLGEYFAVSTDQEKKQWLASFFSKDYPTDLEEPLIVADITAKLRTPYLRDVLECVSCGRLHIQESPGQNVWRSYLPEGVAKAGILKKTTLRTE